MKRPVLAGLLALSASAPAWAFTIYGQDNRMEVVEVSDLRVREAARGIAAMIPTTSIHRSGSEAVLKSLIYGVRPQGAACRIRHV